MAAVSVCEELNHVEVTRLICYIGSSWLNAASADVSLVGCIQKIKAADFIAFDKIFLDLMGEGARLEMIQAFEGDEMNHVHEAPVYVPSTGELVYADTSVVGWLWGLDVQTHRVRTEPSL